MHRDPLRKRRTKASVALSFLCNGLYTCCHACNQHSQWHATYTYVYMYRYMCTYIYIYTCAWRNICESRAARSLLPTKCRDLAR